VGEVKNPDVRLAVAVAASSAFPPVLSPYALKLDPASFTPGSGEDLQKPPFTSKAVLTDGGVYDNLGLETIWKRYDTILVSDAGGALDAEQEPKSDWAQHAYRIVNLVDNQVRALRKRQVIDSYISKVRKGTYWSVRSDIDDFKLADAMPAPFARTLPLAETATRLKRMEEATQERLINWGYAICDAALRKHMSPDLPSPVAPPKGFPYPANPV
jgi:NTE family protein